MAKNENGRVASPESFPIHLKWYNRNVLASLCKIDLEEYRVVVSERDLGWSIEGKCSVTYSFI